MTLLNLVVFYYRMSGFQEPLDFEYDANAPKVDQLLDQSDPEDMDMEQDDEVVIVEECQSQDFGSMLACGEEDLFSQEELSNFQLLAIVNAPTQEDVPVALACPQEVKDALQSMPLDWVEEVENSTRKSLDEQEGLEDLILDCLSLGKTPGRGLCNKSPPNPSNVTRVLVTLLRRLCVLPVSRTPLTPSLVTATGPG